MIRPSKECALNLLRIDVDSDVRLPLPQLCWRLHAAGVHVEYMTETRSPSGLGWHIEIRLRESLASAMEVVAMQCVCGSDLKREACNVARASRVDAGTVDPYWACRWNVLYK